MDWLQFTVDALFVLLLGCILLWIGIYRRLNPHDLPSSRYYRWHQVLVILIAALAILVAVLVVLASNPGDPEDYLYWP